uniref:Globin family profile domain-containing protein n=1 Tax=Romanomermis culicivorax TaxID=13658 RepID=A0A915LBR4_ROMCU
MGNIVGFCWSKYEYDWEMMLKSNEAAVVATATSTADNLDGADAELPPSKNEYCCCFHPCMKYVLCCCCCSGTFCRRMRSRLGVNAGGRPYSLESVRLTLSAREMKILREIWDELKMINNGRVAQKLFALVFSKCPEMKRAFNLSHLSNEEAIKDSRMSHHTLIFQDTFEMILTGLGPENDHMNSLLIAFGSQHSYYTRRKFDPSYWQVFGESFTDLFEDLPASQFRKRRAKQVWIKTIFFILASMKAGYQIGVANKALAPGSRRWWEEVRWRKKTNLESKLLEVLFVTDPVDSK